MDIRIDSSRVLQPIRPVHGVNNGPATQLGIENTIEEFRRAAIPFSRLHDTQGFYGSGEFVNIHCVFPNFDADVDDPANYNFACTDIYIENILKAGTQVFYRLGETLEYRSDLAARYVNPPKDFMKWAQICEHIIRHYNEGWANGFHHNIEYWEIWGEPEHKRLWTGTKEQYFELYRVTANHLKACFPNLKFGGYGGCGFTGLTRTPSQNGQYLIDYATDFFAFISDPKTKAPLDFFSWHLYTWMPDEVRVHGLYVRNLMDQYGFTEAESILDEWNYCKDWSRKEGKFRKSMTAAAMCAAVLTLMQKHSVDKGMYYDAELRRIHFCGLFNEYTFECEKPYYAFLAWKYLMDTGTQIDLGVEDKDGVYSIAAANNDRITLLLANYQSEAKELSLSVPEGKSAQILTLDKEHDLEETSAFEIIDGRLSLSLPTDTVLLVHIAK